MWVSAQCSAVACGGNRRCQYWFCHRGNSISRGGISCRVRVLLQVGRVEMSCLRGLLDGLCTSRRSLTLRPLAMLRTGCALVRSSLHTPFCGTMPCACHRTRPAPPHAARTKPDCFPCHRHPPPLPLPQLAVAAVRVRGPDGGDHGGGRQVRGGRNGGGHAVLAQGRAGRRGKRLVRGAVRGWYAT